MTVAAAAAAAPAVAAAAIPLQLQLLILRLLLQPAITVREAVKNRSCNFDDESTVPDSPHSLGNASGKLPDLLLRR